MIESCAVSNVFFAFFQLRVGPINDGDSFDTDRLSGSIQYDDEPVMDDDDDDTLPPPQMIAPRTDYDSNRKDEKKLRKQEVKKNDDGDRWTRRLEL